MVVAVAIVVVAYVFVVFDLITPFVIVCKTRWPNTQNAKRQNCAGFFFYNSQNIERTIGIISSQFHLHCLADDLHAFTFGCLSFCSDKGLTLEKSA